MQSLKREVSRKQPCYWAKIRRLSVGLSAELRPNWISHFLREHRFYPIDTAITAGLCMANRGGSGDIAVLGAAHRLELISYAQLSSRLGDIF